jgi:hypothetical protein
MTEEEISSINFLADSTKGFTMSDYVATRFIYFSKFKDKRNILEVNEKTLTFIRQSKNDVLVIRNGELNKRPLSLSPSKFGTFIYNPSQMRHYTKESPLWLSLKEYNKIFDSNKITAFN